MGPSSRVCLPQGRAQLCPLVLNVGSHGTEFSCMDPASTLELLSQPWQINEGSGFQLGLMALERHTGSSHPGL
jgi:hypothetical protein